MTLSDQLIEAVRCEPALYNTTHPDYVSPRIKNVLWNRIAQLIGCESGNCAKEAWLRLRNCHRDALRRQQQIAERHGSNSATMCRIWKHQKQMEFLLPYMGKRHLNALGDDNEVIDESSLHIADHYLQVDEVLESKYEIEDDLVTNDSSIQYAQDEFYENTAKRRKFNDTEPNSFGTIVADPKASNVTPNNCSISSEETHRVQPLNHSGNDDALYHFMLSMYHSVKRMPAHVQHEAKTKIFGIIANLESTLLRNVKPVMISASDRTKINSSKDSDCVELCD